MSDQTNKSTKFNKRKHYQIAFHFYFVFNKTNRSTKILKMKIKMREAGKIIKIYLLDSPKI
jgi:hypothetical protein